MRIRASRLAVRSGGLLVAVLVILLGLLAAGIFWPPQAVREAAAAARSVNTPALRLPLTDGRVLILPAAGNAPPLLLDPATGESHALTAFAHGPGAGATATRLADGRWLFWGGMNRDGEPNRNPTLFDPATEQFTPATESPVQPRLGHTTTALPDGRVLVFGGYDADSIHDAASGGASLAEALTYDPATGEIDPEPGAAPAPRVAHQALRLLDGRVLIAGGRDSRGTGLTTAEIWNPATGTRESLSGGAALARDDPALRLLPDGQVLVTGGTGSSIAGARIDGLHLRVEPLSPAAVAQDVRRLEPAPTGTLTASHPQDGATDVPTDGTLGLHFSRPLALGALDARPVTLLGQEGEVPATITLAESGATLWLQPRSDLFPGAAYTLFMTGLRDMTGQPVPDVSLSFSTAVRLEPGAMAAVSPATNGNKRGSGALDGQAAHPADSDTGMGKTAAPPSDANGLRVITGGHAAATLDTHDDEAFVPTRRAPDELWVTGRPLPDFVRRLRDNDPKVKALAAKTERHHQALARPGTIELAPLTPDDGLARAKLRGGTGVSGLVLKLNDQPLAGAVVAVGPHRTRTDDAGRFTLTGLSPGQQALFVDGSGGTGRPYGQTLIGVDLEAGTVNALTYAIYLPRIREEDWIELPAPITRPLTVTHPAMPGFELRLPKGTVLRDRDGKILTRVAVTPIPLDRTPFPTPMRMAAYFNVQPAGIRVQGLTREASTGIRVAYANTAAVKANGVADFWSYEPAGRGWYVYGTGSPTRDGQQIVPATGVGLYEALASGINLSNQPAAPTVAPPPGSCPANTAGDAASGAGDPVDCATGLFLLARTDLAVNDVLPLIMSRIYRPGDAVVRDFGKGMSHSFGLYLRTDTSSTKTTTITLVLPDGGQIAYNKAAGTNGLYDGWFEHRGSPSVWFGSTIRLSGSLFRLALKTGEALEFGAHGEGLIGLRDRFGRRIDFLRQGGNLQRLTSPSGRTLDFSYDTLGRITALVDHTGRRVTYGYNAAGYLARVTDAAGLTEDYEYDTAGRMTRVVDPRGQTRVTNQYDANGRVIRQVLGDSPDDELAVNAVWRFAYAANAAGQVIRTVITDPQGTRRQLEFDSGGHVRRATNALGTPLQRVTTYGRDADSHRVQAEIDPLGRRTAFEYDGTGHLTRLTRLAGTAEALTETFAYTPDNLPASVTDALGRTRRFGYDTLGRLVTLTDALGQVTTLAYNGAHQLTSVTDPNGHAVRFAYDLYDLYAVTDALGRTSRQLTDALGRTLATADALGHRTRYVYDARSRITQVTDALNQVTRLSYDAADNPTSLLDPAGSLTQWRYDALDRVIERTDPLGQAERFVYDPAGRLLTATDRGGRTRGYAYDALHRLTQATYADGATVTYDYDAADRLTQATDAVAGIIQRDYDAFDRLIQETTSQGSITYAYDAAHRRTASQVEGQVAQTYAYDAADRLLTIARGRQVVSYDYDAGGRLIRKTLPNGIAAQFDYDDADQLLAIAYARDATDLGDITYQYDAAGRRIQQDGSLTQVPLPEAVGVADHDPLHRLLTRDGELFDYDADGYLLSDGAASYQWDARGRLSGITQANGAVLARFAYDAFGRRSEKAVSGQATRYLYDGLNPVQELSGTGAVKANLLTGLGVDEFIARFEGARARYYLTDGLGSTLALADVAGTLTTRYAYDPFGNTTTSGEPSGNPFQYTGREHDGTGLYYYRARYYHPATQRFISEDPLGFAAGDANLYAYVGNDPVQYTDSSGLILDTLVDLGFIAYDVYRLAADGNCGLNTNLTALGLDIVGAMAPGVTGLGAGVRAGKKSGVETVQRWMSKVELEATQNTGLLRGGQKGIHYVTDAANTDPLRARQRLALPQTPEVRVTLEVPQGAFSQPSRVDPAFNMPGGGMERTASGTIPVRILEVR